MRSCVGYLRRFGITGTGVGSQIYIGQLLAYSAGLGPRDLPIVVVAAVLATIASIVPRVLSGPAEHPPPTSTLPPRAGRIPPELAMGLQASVAAIVIVALNAAVGLAEFSMGHHRQHLCRGRLRVSYDRPGETSDCRHRDRRPDRSGVPAAHDDRAVGGWGAAALAMVMYTMALPERYDIACGAYAFVLIVTLAIGGEHSVPLLEARAWETLLGGALGLATATLLFPLRPTQNS